MNELIISENLVTEVLNYDKVVNQIKECLNDSVMNFLKIGKVLSYAKTNESYKVNDYIDVYEFAKDQFNLSTTSVKNFIRIYEKFCVGDNILADYGVNIKLKDEYKDYNYSQLTELLTISENEIDNYNPKMSVRQIRENKNKVKILQSYYDLMKKEYQDMNEYIDTSEYIKNNAFITSVSISELIDKYNNNLNYQFDIKILFSDNISKVYNIYYDINKFNLKLDKRFTYYYSFVGFLELVKRLETEITSYINNNINLTVTTETDSSNNNIKNNDNCYDRLYKKNEYILLDILIANTSSANAVKKALENSNIEYIYAFSFSSFLAQNEDFIIYITCNYIQFIFIERNKFNLDITSETFNFDSIAYDYEQYDYYKADNSDILYYGCNFLLSQTSDSIKLLDLEYISLDEIGEDDE